MKNYNEIHYSVLKPESINALNIVPDGTYLDLTTGAGGHSYEIAKRLGGGRLICFDADTVALKIAEERLNEFSEKVTFVNSNFSNVSEVLDGLGIDKIDGALIDLGVSTMQIKEAERGFAYMLDGPLDMRMDRSSPFSAYDVVNNYSESELKHILTVWGEEKFSGRIASAIVKAREDKPIETTKELVGIIERAVPKTGSGGHPAKRTFQAIRIEVNHELDIIEPTLNTLIERLNSNGVLAVITFHSLEDRIVKKVFNSKAGKCTCPPEFPVCVCGCKPIIKVMKDIAPSKEEIEINPPSHSARLRCAVKL